VVADEAGGIAPNDTDRNGALEESETCGSGVLGGSGEPGRYLLGEVDGSGVLDEAVDKTAADTKT
jgi:hypothetical protein